MKAEAWRCIECGTETTIDADGDSERPDFTFVESRGIWVHHGCQKNAPDISVWECERVAGQRPHSNPNGL